MLYMFPSFQKVPEQFIDPVFCKILTIMIQNNRAPSTKACAVPGQGLVHVCIVSFSF
jgi:hypothetical protein